MPKKYLVIFILFVVAIAIVFLYFRPKQSPLSSPSKELPNQDKTTVSATLKEYSDPSGFAFNYPDNLSVSNSDNIDEQTYANILLSDPKVNGSLSLKVADSKLGSLDDWSEINNPDKNAQTQKTSLGTLAALEIKTKDRLVMAAVDKGILFTIEMPRVEEEFWLEVYQAVKESFVFQQQADDSTTVDNWAAVFEEEIAVE